MSKLILLNKPFQVLCQFTDQDGRATLADYVAGKGVYPAGRLDYDSEGLVLLTDDGQLQARIAHPGHKMCKTYWVQVDGQATEKQCRQLVAGVDLKDGRAAAVSCRMIEPPDVWVRTPAVRVRKNIPTSWIELVIDEGRNRQVRRMTAAVGLPTLRLIRIAIGDWSLEQLMPGQSRELQVHLPAPARKSSSRQKAYQKQGRGRRNG